MKTIQVVALVCFSLATLSLTADTLPTPPDLNPFITNPFEQKKEEVPQGVFLSIQQLEEIASIVKDARVMLEKQKREIDHLKSITGCS